MFSGIWKPFKRAPNMAIFGFIDMSSLVYPSLANYLPESKDQP